MELSLKKKKKKAEGHLKTLFFFNPMPRSTLSFTVAEEHFSARCVLFCKVHNAVDVGETSCPSHSSRTEQNSFICHCSTVHQN